MKAQLFNIKVKKEIMTPTEKLLKKEFKIQSEKKLLLLIENKEDVFFKENFFTDKTSYLSLIKSLIIDINYTGNEYSNYMEMVKSGSIMAGGFATAGFGEIQINYRAQRKQLKNHVRFFM
jgi:hypothetical protein